MMPDAHTLKFFVQDNLVTFIKTQTLQKLQYALETGQRIVFLTAVKPSGTAIG